GEFHDQASWVVAPSRRGGGRGGRRRASETRLLPTGRTDHNIIWTLLKGHNRGGGKGCRGRRWRTRQLFLLPLALAKGTGGGKTWPHCLVYDPTVSSRGPWRCIAQQSHHQGGQNLQLRPARTQRRGPQQLHDCLQIGGQGRMILGAESGSRPAHGGGGRTVCR